ncbi:DEAD/DEAH box helicase family protein [Alkaliphilus sp. B6464]|uniref:DEAD/DEAH box helicase family protein n=1 Tax=Alkaliphilus sp. B6464 TaxID=2731219 RepID=UPI001BA73548|nr:DEAD/DEAH box helicase [Alkaliphilus sp. B6464]QUH20220.1 DEAD/DEAH box helicase family protein [Alkaliphilus sp. B6464]
MKKYVSDVITTKHINNWNNGDVILITAPTGRGKSTLILRDLQEIAKLENEKILLLTNRDLLKNQFKNIITTTDTIKVINYQLLENIILNQKEIKELSNYKYIICDEAHYFFTDSGFNNLTDLSLKWILEQYDKIRIMMSATASTITNYIKQIGIEFKEYKLKHDYSYIDTLYFYEDDQVLKKMLFELPSNEKALYFTLAKKAYETSQELDNASFLCSKHNKRYSQYVDNEIRKQIVEQDMFSSQILCTTTTLDNGVNIKDNQVKHIIIDVFDVDTIEQCLGRRRIGQGEKTNVYIKKYSNQSLSGKRQGLINTMRYANMLRNEGIEELIKQYPRKSYGNLIYDVVDNGNVQKRINEIMYFKCEDTINFCDDLLSSNKKDNYARYIAKRFKYDYKNTFNLDDMYNCLTLSDKLEKLIGIKLYKQDQLKLIDDIDVRVDGKQQRSISKLNEGLKMLKLPYLIIKNVDKDRKLLNGEDNPNRDKTYWQVIKSLG